MDILASMWIMPMFNILNLVLEKKNLVTSCHTRTLQSIDMLLPVALTELKWHDSAQIQNSQPCKPNAFTKYSSVTGCFQTRIFLSIDHLSKLIAILCAESSPFEYNNNRGHDELPTQTSCTRFSKSLKLYQQTF